MLVNNPPHVTDVAPFHDVIFPVSTVEIRPGPFGHQWMPKDHVSSRAAPLDPIAKLGKQATEFRTPGAPPLLQ